MRGDLPVPIGVKIVQDTGHTLSNYPADIIGAIHCLHTRLFGELPKVDLRSRLGASFRPSAWAINTLSESRYFLVSADSKYGALIGA